MKQLLSMVAISLALTTATVAYGRNYKPYPTKFKTFVIKNAKEGCMTDPNANLKFCTTVAKCFLRKAEYNLPFKVFYRELVRVGRGGKQRAPLTTYIKTCAEDNAYLLF